MYFLQEVNYSPIVFEAADAPYRLRLRPVADIAICKWPRDNQVLTIANGLVQ